ncbi:P-loop NTPase fold protein [Flavobacterium cyclinae]|uniref:P-loop NTPase fold protein n=1 Tax=Flavobacterium cyclinae TaxID=2895947 RepID=UPI001E5DAFC8|nr:P-loop NTPase fold protein [Flavobacterium cyclinae]UGS22084.1 KAP family NTPase [Flavobacterium cyclinae]
MNTNFDYNILREEVQGLDEFEVPTHEKIKCSIINLLKKETEGINIGLSGTWGSGKSTIINLLKNDEQNRDKFTFFYFDAWAHEGDPLRRIFLESFINTLKESTKDELIIQALEKKRKIISREEVIKTIKVDKTTTKLGVFLSIATLVFTIGAAILSSINYENLTLGIKESINYPFLIASLLTLAPFIVLISNYFILKKQNLDPKDLKNWAFIHNSGTETITEEVSVEDERTSIEFEKFFREIIEIFDKEANKKIVLILDNLDRVEAAVSLNLWSTLQTFIQHKNPATKDYNSFKNVYSIIPYDEESLKRIWNNHDTNEDKQSKKTSNNSNSFFDKSFQIRIDVPKPILSNWTNYLDKMIAKCMPNWSDNDKREIVQVLQLTRENVLDNPKPREIKIYLNQIAFFRNHFEKEISTKTISFFVYKRFLKGLSNDEITNYLIDKAKIQPNEFNIINDELINELSAIVYGVNKEEGKQTLIGQQIAKAFESEDGKLLKDISDNFKNVFWHVFDNLMNKITTLNDYLKYSIVLNVAFKEKNENLKNIFILNFSRSLISDKNYSDNLNSLLKLKYTNAVDLLLRYNKIKEINSLWLKFIKIFQESDKNNEIDIEKENIFIDTAYYFIQNTKMEFPQKELNLRLETWKKISTNPKYNLISKCFYPTVKNFNDVCNEISAGAIVNQNTLVSLENSVNYNKLNLDHLLTKLQQHFFWNNGNQNVNTVNFQVIELFEKVFYNYKDYEYANFFGNPSFYAYLHTTLNQDNNVVKRIAVFNACYFNSGLMNIRQSIIQNNQRGNQTINQILSFWSNSNVDNALFAYNILKENNKLQIIWSLTNDTNFNLVYDVINLILHNNEYQVFNVNNSLQILKQLDKKESSVFDVASVINPFIENSSLIQDLIDIEKLDFKNDDYILYHILKNNNSIELINKVKNELLVTDKEIFLDSLNVNDYLFDILLQIKKNDKKFTLNFLNDVLYEFIYGSLLINNPVYQFDDWHKKNWIDIINLFDENNVSNFSDRITILINNEKGNLKEVFFEINKQFINTDLLIKNINTDIEIFQLYIQEAVSDFSNKLNELKFIDNVLKIDSDKKIKFKRGYKSVIETYILNIDANTVSNEILKIIENIKFRLKIK